MTKQYVLLVDEKDTFEGLYEEKEKCHQGKGIHHRAFVVLLYNKKGQVLLQKRRHIRWDNYWDLTAISHVLHLSDNTDETYEEAALRSLQVEMGISNVKLKKIGGFNYYAQYGKQCENEYCAVLVGEFDGEVKANTDVVYEWKWEDEASFLTAVMKKDSQYTPWAIHAAKILQSYAL